MWSATRLQARSTLQRSKLDRPHTKAQAHVAGEHPRESVRGWRHMERAHTPVEGVAVALAIGLDSCDSPSALSVPRAHSIDRSALESPLRSPRLYVLYNLAVLVG